MPRRRSPLLLQLEPLLVPRLRLRLRRLPTPHAAVSPAAPIAQSYNCSGAKSLLPHSGPGPSPCTAAPAPSTQGEWGVGVLSPFQTNVPKMMEERRQALTGFGPSDLSAEPMLAQAMMMSPRLMSVGSV